jgi:hypothetical protein
MASFGWSPSKGCKDAPKGHDHGNDHDDKDHRPVSWHHKHSHNNRHDWDKKNSGGHCG